MAQPTYAQWTNLGSSANGLTPQTVQERIIAALAVLDSGVNPDGTTFTLLTH